MRKYIVILILFITVSIKAQDIHTVITGAASNTSGAITTTTDGGYVAVGSMKLLRKDCPYIVKLSSTGAIQWAKAITNSSFNTDDLSGILQTSDGGFLLSGSQLIKIDSFGNVEWYKFEYSGKAIQTSDGGYAICGSVHGNSGTVTQFIKLDGTGNYEWHVSYIDTTGKETGATITTAIEAQDGYYVFGEASRVSNTPRQMLTHISKAGTIIWHRGYSLNGTKTAFAAGLTRTTDNGFVMGCYTFPLSFSGTDDEADQLCIKLDSLGNVLWTIEIDGFSPETVTKVLQLPNHEIACVGNQLNDSLSSLFVTTISENGKLQSAKRLVPPHRGITVIDAVITPDSALLLTGNIRNPKTPSDDLFAVTLNENTCFTSNTLVVTSHPTVTIDTNYLITPTTIAAPSGTLYNLLSTGSQVDFCSLAAGVSSPPNPTSAICYPNPLEDNRNLTIVFAMPLKAGGYISIIENALGAEVYHRQQRLTGAEQMISLETSDLPAGIYTIELLDPNTFAPVWRGKVVKVN